MGDTPAKLRKTTLSKPAQPEAARTWGPYFDAIFPAHEVTPWIAWKISSTGANIARRLWDQRQEMRRAYESVARHSCCDFSLRSFRASSTISLTKVLLAGLPCSSGCR
jgi:hypothetical protein